MKVYTCPICGGNTKVEGYNEQGSIKWRKRVCCDCGYEFQTKEIGITCKDCGYRAKPTDVVIERDNIYRVYECVCGCKYSTYEMDADMSKKLK